MKPLFFLPLVIGLFCSFSFGQTAKARIRGTITEGSSSQTVSGAKIELKSLNTGAVAGRALSESNGAFEFRDVPFGNYRFTVTLISFDTIVKDVKISKSEHVVNLSMSGSLEFDEVRVIGNIVKDGPVPIAVTKISAQKIQEELGSRDLPMLLNGTAGGLCHPVWWWGR